MKISEDIMKYKDRIYSITRKFIEEKYPKELPFFAFAWNDFLNILNQLKDKDPQEWKISDLRKTPSTAFRYPSGDVNLKLEAVGMAAFSTLADLIKLKKEPTRREIEEIIKTNIKQFNAPESVLSDILSMVIKVDGRPISSIPKDEIEAFTKRSKEEKKEYKIYSNEYSAKSYNASEKEVEELENLRLEEKGERFDIYYNTEKNFIILKGQEKPFKEGGKRGSKQIKPFLFLFLANVGRFVALRKIERIIWGPQETVSDDTIKQLYKRFRHFTNNIIHPFVDHDIDERGNEGFFINEADKNGDKLKYCMICYSEKPGN